MPIVTDLAAVSLRLRQHVLRMISTAGSSHVGSCFSIAELLTALYFDVLEVRPDEPKWPDRDRFILSKGHACAVLYAALAERGFFPLSWLDTFYQNGSRLAGHATTTVPGIEVSTGSLGHGLPIGLGMALAGRRDGRNHRVVVMLSDGECDEGTVWEAAMLAAHHRLSNLTVIIDYNKIQSLGAVEDVIRLEPFADKWAAFGWRVLEVDGHNLHAVVATLRDRSEEQPTCVIAHTVKGKGVPFMEHQLLWHYRTPRGEELEQAERALEGGVA